MPYVYRNKSDLPLVIPQVGEVEPKGEITSPIKLENPNLEEIQTVSSQVNEEENK